jgi:hypothetical protein
LIIGVALAAIVFAAMYFWEKAGFLRDLSKFEDVQGNLELAFVGVFYALIGAGFYEEFTFRGFLMQGLAMCLVEVAAPGLALVFCKGRCSGQRALTRIPRESRSPAHLPIDGTAGSGVGAKSLGRDHRTRALRRESVRPVLFSRPTDWLSSSRHHISDSANANRIDTRPAG